MKNVTFQIFESANEYCAFRKILARTGYEVHHIAKFPRIAIHAFAPCESKIFPAYAMRYRGVFGTGWRLCIRNVSLHNDIAIYLIREEK